MTPLRLKDLLDMARLEENLRQMQAFTGIGLVIVDREGDTQSFLNQAVCSHFQIKTDSGELNRQGAYAAGSLPCAACPEGLRTEAIPIIFAGEELGVLFMICASGAEAEGCLNGPGMGEPRIKKRTKKPGKMEVLPQHKIDALKGFLVRHIDNSLTKAVRQAKELEEEKSALASQQDSMYLFNNAQVGIFRSRIEDGLILAVNNWLAQFLGYSDKKEGIGKVSSIKHYMNAEQRQEMMNRFVDNELKNYDVQVKKKDGSLIWMNFSGRICPEKGYIEGVLMDISARREAEEALRESEAFHSTLFQNSHAVKLLIDQASGDIYDANPAAAAFYGYTLDDLRKKNLSDLTTAPAEELLKTLAALTESGSTDYYCHRLANGEIRNIEARRGLVVVKGRRMVYSIINDITERKRWEESLCASERRLADIIDFLPDATYAVDQSGRVIAWNRAAEELTGISASAMLGKGDYEYSLLFYGKRRPILIDLVLAPEKLNVSQYPFIRQEGESLVGEDFCSAIGAIGAYMWGKASPLYDDQGRLIGAIESVRDVTTRRRAEINQERELRKFRILFDLAVAMTAENSMDENMALLVEKAGNFWGLRLPS